MRHHEQTSHPEPCIIDHCSPVFLQPLVVQAADRPFIQATLVWSKPAIQDLASLAVLKFMTSATLATGGPPEESPEGASLKRGSVELLDVQTGTVAQRIFWSAPLSTSNFALRAVLPLSDGRFVFQSWDQLTLFSAAGEIVTTRTLPMESRRADYNPNLTHWDIWQFAASPDGRDLLAIRRAVNSREIEEHWLSVETLEDVQVRSDSARRPYMTEASCTTAVGREQDLHLSGGPKKEPIVIRTKNGAAHPLCPKCYGSAALFLDDNHIVVSGWPRARFLVVSTEGQIQVDRTVGGKDDHIIQMSVAALSQQVAFLRGPQRMQNNTGKYSVFIYDAVRKKAVLLLQIPEHIHVERVESLGIMETRIPPQIALSPDGRSLAILDDSSLQMYGLTP